MWPRHGKSYENDSSGSTVRKTLRSGAGNVLVVPPVMGCQNASMFERFVLCVHRKSLATRPSTSSNNHDLSTTEWVGDG